MNDDNGHRVSPDDYRHSAPWNASYSYGEPDAHSSSTAELSLRRTTNELRVAHELRKRLRMDKRRQTPPRVFTSGADEIAPCDDAVGPWWAQQNIIGRGNCKLLGHWLWMR